MKFPFPSCAEVHDHMTDLLEGSAPLHKRLLWRLHVAFCDLCRPVFEVFLALRREGPKLLAPPAEAPPEAKAALGSVLSKIKDEKRP